MIDPFTRTRFHPDLKLDTWYPEGVLDGAMAAFMIRYLGFQERMLDNPFNRFVDMTKITEIQLDFRRLADLAAERREAYTGRPPVKSGVIATSADGYRF